MIRSPPVLWALIVVHNLFVVVTTALFRKRSCIHGRRVQLPLPCIFGHVSVDWSSIRSIALIAHSKRMEKGPEGRHNGGGRIQQKAHSASTRTGSCWWL